MCGPPYRSRTARALQIVAWPACTRRIGWRTYSASPHGRYSWSCTWWITTASGPMAPWRQVSCIWMASGLSMAAWLVSCTVRWMPADFRRLTQESQGERSAGLPQASAPVLGIGHGFGHQPPKSTEWFLTVRCAISWTMTYSISAGVIILARQPGQGETHGWRGVQEPPSDAQRGGQQVQHSLEGERVRPGSESDDFSPLGPASTACAAKSST